MIIEGKEYLYKLSNSAVSPYQGLTNFSSGQTLHVSPFEDRGPPPQINYSLQSTSRFVYRDPFQYLSGKGMEWSSLRSTRSEPDGPAIGIIPPGLPQLSEEGNVVNAQKGNDEILQNDGWNNAALREVRRYTGNLTKTDQS